MYANDAGDLSYLDNPRYARYWTDFGGSGANRYAVFEPLSRTERLSQIATSNRWRAWAGEFAGGVGRFAAAVPLFGEAVTAAAKVVEDVYHRPKRPRIEEYRLVTARENEAMVNPSTHTTQMYAPGYQREVSGGSRNVNQGGHVQYTKRRSRKGRRMRQGKMIRKLVKQDLVTLIDRFIGINPYSGNQGYFKLWNHQNTTEATDRGNVLPWHLYDLTITPNLTPSVGGKLPTFAHGGVLKDGNGSTTVQRVLWVPFRGSDRNGANYSQSVPFPEFDDNVAISNANNECGPRTILEWVDIRLLLYGNSSNFNRWTIELLQFAYEEDVPGGLVPLQTDVGAGFVENIPTQVNSGSTQYQKTLAAIRPYTFSPIMPSERNERQPYIKVLKRYEFCQQPKATTVGDTDTPPVQEYRLFWRANRMCNFDWYPKASTVNAANLQNDTTGLGNSILTNQQGSNVTAKARVFLSIRANSQYETGTTGVTPETVAGAGFKACSYDISIRRKWIDMD